MVEGVVRLVEAGRDVPTPMNLGNPREFTMRATAELVARILGVPARFERRPLPADDPRQRSPDIRLARKHLHWSPRIPFEAGLARTVEYFRALGIGR
jgi:UDP-glucuronate decarboxylase